MIKVHNCGQTVANEKEGKRFQDKLKAFDDSRNNQQNCAKLYSLICKSKYILKVRSMHRALR